MAIEDYTLFDSFQDKGYWWLPETPDKQVPGILFHGEKETRLELFGDLYEETLEEKRIVRQPRPVPIILGWMENQGVCTLYKNQRTSQRLAVFGGATSTKWSSQVLFVGKHFDKEVDIVFMSMGANYTNLEEWVSEPPFKAPVHKMEGDRLIEFESAYAARDPIDVEIPTLDAILKIECDARFVHRFQSRTMEYMDYVWFYPKAPQHLNWYLAAYKDWAGLLSLFIGEPVYEKRLIGCSQMTGAQGYLKEKAVSILYTDDEIPPRQEAQGYLKEKAVSIFLHHRNRHQYEAKHPAQMLVALPWIKGWYAEAFKKWFEKSSTLRDVYNLFFSTLYAPGAFVQADFLNLIQAVESFSRTRGADLHVTEEVYKPIKEKMLAAIPAGIDQGLKESLEGHINFGNQHSLKRRIDAILGSLDSETVKLFCPDAAAFKKKVADTRNYLAHWDVKSKKKALHGKALWVANERLRLLLTILLLKEICFKEDAIRQRLMEHPDWMQLIHLYLANAES